MLEDGLHEFRDQGELLDPQFFDNILEHSTVSCKPDPQVHL